MVGLCGPESAYLIITIVFTMFFCWATQEILERVFNMAPVITSNNAMVTRSALNLNVNNHRKWVMNKRLTKSLDHRGRYRIQTRGTVYYIKAAWAIPIFVTSIIVFTVWPDWFKDHFIYLKADTVCFQPYQHIAASILALYLWELMANRYGKLDWGIIVHHWLTIIASASIILGRYTPFATWYGFSIVSMAPPINIAFGIRATYSNKLPKLTRMAFKFSFWYWLGCITCCISGQFFLIINCLIPQHFNKSVSVYMVAFMSLSIVGWVYDDYQLLKALYDFSTHSYEDAEILMKDKQKSGNLLGGRDLFGLSVAYEIDTFKKNTIKNSGQPMPVRTTSAGITSDSEDLGADGMDSDPDPESPRAVTVHVDIDKEQVTVHTPIADLDTPTNSNMYSPKLEKKGSLKMSDFQSFTLVDSRMQHQLQMKLAEQQSISVSSDLRRTIRNELHLDTQQTMSVSSNLRKTIRNELDQQQTLKSLQTLTPISSVGQVSIGSGVGHSTQIELENMSSMQIDEILDDFVDAQKSETNVLYSPTNSQTVNVDRGKSSHV